MRLNSCFHKIQGRKTIKGWFHLPVPLTDWVSYIVPVTKKWGTIRVCVDYRDINKACPKDNCPTHSINQIIDDCACSEVFSFMDGFSRYNQINILPADQHKTAFIFPWGTFVYNKLPFVLKNASANFQRGCHMISTTSGTSFSHILTTYPPTPNCVGTI